MYFFKLNLVCSEVHELARLINTPDYPTIYIRTPVWVNLRLSFPLLSKIVVMHIGLFPIWFSLVKSFQLVNDGLHWVFGWQLPMRGICSRVGFGYEWHVLSQGIPWDQILAQAGEGGRSMSWDVGPWSLGMREGNRWSTCTEKSQVWLFSSSFFDNMPYYQYLCWFVQYPMCILRMGKTST